MIRKRGKTVAKLLRELKGVGEKTEKLFQKIGITTTDDLLHYYPRNYDSYEAPEEIGSLKENSVVSVSGTVTAGVYVNRIRNLQVISITVADTTGKLPVVWFNAPYLKNTLKKGSCFIFRGKISRKKGHLEMEHPEIFTPAAYEEILHSMQPIYGLTAGLTNKLIIKLMHQILDEQSLQTEFLPDEIKEFYHLADDNYAISTVHFPGNMQELNPKDTDKSWSVEVFIPWTSVFQMDRGKEKPEIGEQIRVNFSRVEWTTDVKDGKYVKVPIQGEDKIREYNWVWAPTGVINIHMPEYWGYVQISDKIAGEGETPFVKHPSEETKWILRNLYYRQNEFAATFGHYADNINDLKANELCPQEIANQLEIHTTPSMYEISLPAPDGTVWNIRQDGLVWPKKK